MMRITMVTARGQRELERTASWVSVRSGLSWLIGIWIVLTLGGAAVQLQSLRLAPALSARDPGALVLMAMTSVGYQVFYSLVVLALVMALVRLTRVPPATGAVGPALIATTCFVVVSLGSFAILFGVSGGSSEGISTRELWILVAAARAGGLVALVLALGRMARALDASVPQSVLGAAFAFVAVDAGIPLYRILASAVDAQPAGQRAVLLVIQLLLAAVVIDLARRVKRAARAAAESELIRPAGEPEPQGQADSGLEADDRDEAGDEPDEAPLGEGRPATPGSDAARNAAFVLVLAMVAVFPVWDTLAAGHEESPVRAILMSLGALVAALLVRQLMLSSPYGARGVFALAVLGALAYAAPRAWESATLRSHQIDAWPVCETGLDLEGNLPGIESTYRGPYDGPRLPSGEPCVLAAERRDQHTATSPRGDFGDGIVQIGTRFPDDRRRVLFGSLAWILIAVVAGFLIWRAAEP